MYVLRDLVPLLDLIVRRHTELRCRTSRADGELLSPIHRFTGTDYVSDREFPVILKCESEFSRIRRVPIEYVLEFPFMRQIHIQMDGTLDFVAS